MITIIGIPLARLGICLYVILLALGYLASAAAIGEWPLPRIRREAEVLTRQRILMFLVDFPGFRGRLSALILQPHTHQGSRRPDGSRAATNTGALCTRRRGVGAVEHVVHYCSTATLAFTPGVHVYRVEHAECPAAMADVP